MSAGIEYHVESEKRELNLQELENQNIQQNESMNKRFLEKPPLNPNDTELLNVLNVPPQDAQNVKVFDELPNGLKLYHYIDHKNKNTSHVRGIVVATAEDHPRVVCQSFPYTVEVTTKNLDLSNEDVKTSVIMNGYEGTLLRVFHYAGVWYLSTHKKINGKMSRWNSPTFGELFCECWKSNFDFSILNRDYCYVFLMSHPQNSLVCVNPRPLLYHIQTFDFLKNEKVTSQIDHPNVAYPKTSHFETCEDLKKYVNEMSWQTYSGVIVFLENGNVMKVMNEEYHIHRQIRGNEPNLRSRYFQLSKIEGMRSEDLLKVLPNKREFFERCERDKYNLVRYLYDIFEYRHINGKYLRLPKEENYFLGKMFDEEFSNLKGQFLDKPTKNNIRSEIQKRLNENVPPHILSVMIKHMNQ